MVCCSSPCRGFGRHCASLLCLRFSGFGVWRLKTPSLCFSVTCPGFSLVRLPAQVCLPSASCSCRLHWPMCVQAHEVFGFWLRAFRFVAQTAPAAVVAFGVLRRRMGGRCRHITSPRRACVCCMVCAGEFRSPMCVCWHSHSDLTGCYVAVYVVGHQKSQCFTEI